MIKSVTVTNYIGDSITYNMENPTIDDKSGLLITSIDGLGPPKATINISDITTTDGGLYNSSRCSTRNIVIKALYTYAKTIEEARLMSYKFFPIRRKVGIAIVTENRAGYAEGYVESNEPDIFSDQCSCQISILCPEPFFTSAYGDITTKIANVVPMFHFKYWNPVNTQETIMGKMKQSPFEETIWYDGDIDTGFIMRFYFNGPVTNMKITNEDTNQFMSIIHTFGTEGYMMTIDTRIGKKSITVGRPGGGYTMNYLKYLSDDSSWLTMAKGNNHFVFETDSGDGNFSIEIEMPQLYVGV